jgi:hypothetical protein
MTLTVSALYVPVQASRTPNVLNDETLVLSGLEKPNQDLDNLSAGSLAAFSRQFSQPLSRPVNKIFSCTLEPISNRCEH